jgi:hypothetical protein
MSLDVLLVAAGLIVLASVMAFLTRQPGQRSRAQMSKLLHGSIPEPKAGEHSIFISYRRSDSADVVGRLYEHLTSKYGTTAVFKDVDTLIAGGDFRTQIERSLNACQVFLCIMGSQWAGPQDGRIRRIDDPRDFVRIEVETALGRGIPVIPVLVGGMKMPPLEFFPDSLRELAYRHALLLRADPDFRNDASRLTANISEHLTLSNMTLRA